MPATWINDVTSIEREATSTVRSASLSPPIFDIVVVVVVVVGLGNRRVAKARDYDGDDSAKLGMEAGDRPGEAPECILADL